MKNKRIIVHCGFRKAGSTSIQRLLRKNRKILSRNAFVSVRDALTETFRGHAISYARSRKPHLLSKMQLEAVRIANQVREVEQDTILISDENLFGSAVFHEDGTTIFDWAAETLPILEAELGIDNTVFYFVQRRMDRWLESAYKQDVGNAFCSLTYEEWLAAIPDGFTWETGSQLIKNSLESRCIFVAMESLLSEDSVMGRDLLRVAGLDEEIIMALPDPGRANSGLSWEAINILRQVNATNLNRQDKKDIAETYRLAAKRSRA